MTPTDLSRLVRSTPPAAVTDLNGAVTLHSAQINGDTAQQWDQLRDSAAANDAGIRRVLVSRQDDHDRTPLSSVKEEVQHTHLFHISFQFPWPTDHARFVTIPGLLNALKHGDLESR